LAEAPESFRHQEKCVQENRAGNHSEREFFSASIKRMASFFGDFNRRNNFCGQITTNFSRCKNFAKTP
jgi:hypothetical protein